MPRLVNNVSGAAADTDQVNNVAPIIFNNDPLNVGDSLLYTVYGWAATWDTAVVTLYITPQAQGAQEPPVWFPLLDASGAPVVLSGANKYINFSARFGAIKGEITNASSSTAGLCVTLFNPSLSFAPNSP